MKSKKIITVLTLTIMLISFVIYKNNSNTVYSKINKSLLINNDIINIKKNCDSGVVIYCEFKDIVISATKGEIKNVLQSMEILENRSNNKNSYPIDCHGLAHAVGKIFYYHIGLKNSVSTKNICTAGIYHGAFEEWGTNSKIADVKKQIKDICNEKDKASASYILCIHGTGRALYRSSNEILSGSEGCSQVFENKDDEQGCFTGVLSSHILMEFAKKNEVEDEYINKLIFDCEKINKKFQHGCTSISVMEYIKQKYLWRMSIKDKEKLLFELNKYVELCKNLDLITKQACAQGIGNATVEIVATFESEYFKSNTNLNMEYSNQNKFRVVKKEDIAKSMHVCQKFNENLIGSCIGGAVLWVLGHLADDKLAKELCDIANTDQVCVNLKNSYKIYTKLN